MRLRVLAVTVGLLLPLPVLSQESGTLLSGNDLYNMCDAQSVACAGYVAGMADAFVRDGTLCLPPTNVTTRQLADVVMGYLRAHPEARGYSAASVGHVAFTQTFPCASKRPPG
jgi:Rap1a immunity proteins